MFSRPHVKIHHPYLTGTMWRWDMHGGILSMHSILSCDSQVLFKVHYVAGIVLNQMSNVVGTRNYFIIEGSLEVKLPINMDRWTAEQGRGREKRKIRREKIRRESQKKEDADARKGRKVAKHCVFPMICGSGESKSRFAKACGCGASWPDERWPIARRCGAKHISKSKCTKHLSSGPLLEVEMSKKCTPLWREAHLQVKMYKTPGVRTTFGSWDVEKVHAVVARSTFRSQNVQNTPFSDHFCKLRCRKRARRCGAKHISKSKVLKTDGLGPLLEVQMSKKCRKSARRCGAKHISKSKV